MEARITILPLFRVATFPLSTPEATLGGSPEASSGSDAGLRQLFISFTGGRNLGRYGAMLAQSHMLDGYPTSGWGAWSSGEAGYQALQQLVPVGLADHQDLDIFPILDSIGEWMRAPHHRAQNWQVAG